MPKITQMSYLNTIHVNIPRNIRAETFSTLIIVPALYAPEPRRAHSSINRFSEYLTTIPVYSAIMVIVAMTDGHHVSFCWWWRKVQRFSVVRVCDYGGGAVCYCEATVPVPPYLEHGFCLVFDVFLSCASAFLR